MKIQLDSDRENMDGSLRLPYKFDCEHPRSYNEKLVWLKLHYRDEKWVQLTDKLGGKDFLVSKGFGKYVPATYQICNTPEEIDMEELPNKFVLKTNTDCGSVFVCDKQTTNFVSTFEKLRKGLSRDYSVMTNEWNYHGIIPKVFVEEALSPDQGNDLKDYKFFIFSGKVQFLYVAQARNRDVRFTLFNRNFEPLDVLYLHLPACKKNFPKKPVFFDEMVKLAEEVGSYFDFIRVDMYATSKGPKFGELTFFSQSGKGFFFPSSFDFKLGSFIDLSKYGYNEQN